MIIGINGRVGSGKDTVGRIIQYLIRGQQDDSFSEVVELKSLLESKMEDPFNSEWPIKKFASKLKKMATMLTGIPTEMFEDQDFKKTALGPEWGGMIVREFLQKLGTEGIRNNIHTNAWVNALFADYIGATKTAYFGGPKSGKIEEHEPIFPNWIITDCRFPNEAQAIKDRGGVLVRVTRPGENRADLHPSETSLDDWNFDYTISNEGTIQDLIPKVQEVLQKVNIL